MLPGMGATGNVGRGWGMLPWGCRVIGTPVGAGGYRDAAMGVPPACVPMSRLLDSPVRRGIGVSSAALTRERLRRPIPALCQGSWRVPTAQPGCHDNGRQPALPFRYRDSSICSGNQERGRRETLCCPPPSNPVPCSKYCTLLHPAGIFCSFTCHLFAPVFWGLPAFFWPPSAHLQGPTAPTSSQHHLGKCPLAQGLGPGQFVSCLSQCLAH